ncbi:hypothetical protein [Paraburkholderia caffeinilytica]|uniref:hypothetical protein n=1 Tax=Paraburkholderia caffeinilytica TaxID=1761016 RepID=UPI0038BCF6E4
MLKTVDETLAMLAAEAEQLGYVVFVSGKLRIDAEYHRGQTVWFINERRATRELAAQKLENARAARRAEQPGIA